MEKMDTVLVIFEKWASSKGLALKHRADAKPSGKFVYEDPITQTVWEGYLKGSSEAGYFWMARFTAAEVIIKHNGLEQEYNEALQRMEKSLSIARGTMI